ncbi:hypothetical protein [Ulvibacterium marinum]|uniref:Uncharacterized protein n=1 Tax=Ulvibacterium marinum TaxID=2419782 RepID=A0A3B0C7G6_9FLAO|nr:hypothetical protein [Ulvibacterium marinum]RKN81070.1 hypothetical protein D7Z94_08975 [Ulvibacterium marinum]
MRKLTGLIFFLISFCVVAQIDSGSNQVDMELASFVNPRPEYDNSEGSRYLFEDFTPAKINDSQKTHLVRFDVVENTIEIQKSETKIISLPKDQEYTIELLNGSNKIYRTLSYNDKKGDLKITFFEEIKKTHHYTLYSKEQIFYVPPKETKVHYEESKYGKFIEGRTKYYFVEHSPESSRLIEIPKKKKTLINLFGKYSSPMAQFIKKEKIKIEEEEDAFKILDHYFKLKS